MLVKQQSTKISVINHTGTMDSEIFPDLNHSTDTARRLIPLAGNQAAATLAALEPILL